MSANPHPLAGKPPHYLEVGTVDVCIPCTVKSRHEWADRAMTAEGRLGTLLTSTPADRERLAKEIAIRFDRPHLTDQQVDAIWSCLRVDAKQIAYRRADSILALMTSEEAVKHDEWIRIYDQVVYAHEQFEVSPEGDAAFRFHILKMEEIPSTGEKKP